MTSWRLPEAEACTLTDDGFRTPHLSNCDSLVCLSLLPRIAEFLNGGQDVESLDDLSEGDGMVVEL